MTFRAVFISIFIFAFSAAAFGQIDSLIGQISDSSSEVFAGGISGDGRFIVFESRGNLATENPRNEDGNREIFLYDYAQRRIFQITDTKSVLFSSDQSPLTFSNIRVEIANVRPIISADGRWIAFSSNATSATPAVPNATNPGLFDGNTFTSPTPTPTPTVSPTATPNPTATPTPTPAVSPTPTPTPSNPLTTDANLEMWLYQIPVYAPVANLSLGDEIAFVNLAGGSFTLVTNTDPSQLPRAATTTNGAFVADDNHDASISDDGNVIAFASTRNLVPSVGNAFPTEDNDEIFTYVRTSTTLGQVTKTPRGPITSPIYSKNPTISGNGQRVTFASTGDDPIDDPGSATNFDTGTNPASSRNEEVFFANLVNGVPTGGKQVTTTTSTNLGDPVNILDLGRRMSKDGRYIAFDSYADLANENSGRNYNDFATFLYDATANTFRRICARSTADSAASGGDAARYPGFTDNDVNGTPSTFVLETRLNIKADGTIPATASDGLNPDTNRPTQIYSYPLNVPAATATFTRLAKFPAGDFFSSTQLITSNSLSRMAFNFSQTELGTRNIDGLSEVYYFLKPAVTSTATLRGVEFFTGATHQLTVKASPTPTPSPTATPTPGPTPSPTPITPTAVYGLSNGMLTIVEFGRPRSIAARTAVSSNNRSPGLPYELSGVSATINGIACLLRSVDSNQIVLVTPRFLTTALTGTTYPIVINDNGTALKGTTVIVPARPDIFNTTLTPVPGGRSKLFNVTNSIFTTEPYSIRTIKRKGNTLTPSVLRLYLTGVANIGTSAIEVRIKDRRITGVVSSDVLVEPGVYTVDFLLPAELEAAGDSPVVVTVNITTSGGATTSFTSRLDDTTSKTSIL